MKDLINFFVNKRESETAHKSLSIGFTWKLLKNGQKVNIVKI